MTTLQVEIMQFLQLVVNVAVVAGLAVLGWFHSRLDKLHASMVESEKDAQEGDKELHKRINTELVSYREFKEMREEFKEMRGDVKFLRRNIEGRKPPAE